MTVCRLQFLKPFPGRRARPRIVSLDPEKLAVTFVRLTSSRVPIGGSLGRVTGIVSISFQRSGLIASTRLYTTHKIIRDPIQHIDLRRSRPIPGIDQRSRQAGTKRHEQTFTR